MNRREFLQGMAAATASVTLIGVSALASETSETPGEPETPYLNEWSMPSHQHTCTHQHAHCGIGTPGPHNHYGSFCQLEAAQMTLSNYPELQL